MSTSRTLDTLLDSLKTADPGLEWPRLSETTAQRLETLAAASPIYARTLQQYPDWALWLNSPEVAGQRFGFGELLHDWRSLLEIAGKPDRTSERYLSLLRRFRRRHSLRIAWRDVNGLAETDEVVRELSRLAEFCIRECLFVAAEQWTRRLGAPWDETRDMPARFCVLGLGKLGGGELNFSSDVDLVYLYEGDGRCRRDGQPTSAENADYFRRVGETITTLLNSREADGFLFRADLRLRPGGPTGALVPSISAIENYYAGTQQTWERLALLKARPIAGDLALGAELLENLHSFRYPRHPPSGLLAEIAATKLRTEKEIVGANALERDVKSGYGGIREIEFLAQTLQLLHAGRYPFLQTHSTVEALQQLARYSLLSAGDVGFLLDAYWLLRRVEHRVQIVDEQRIHELPADAGERGRIARSLGFQSVEQFDARLAYTRVRVREHYSALFRDAAPASADITNAWWGFFAEDRADARVRRRLESWFHNQAAGRHALTLLVRRSERQPLLREQVQRFSELTPILDRVMPSLARPEETLQRIASFAESFGSQSQFLSTCTLNPEFLKTLALLFDRSRFIHELLTHHPSILEEVLRPENLRQEKDLAQRRRELAATRDLNFAEYCDWLWMYVRAETVRAAIGQLLDYLDDEQVGSELALLAESVISDVVSRIPEAGSLLVVGLGSIGGGTLSFGADLDVLFIAPGEVPGGHEKVVQRVIKALGPTESRNAIYNLDLRLRPFGDAGPVAPDLKTLHKYFEKTARLWERQSLTRARVLAGPAEQTASWQDFVASTIYARALTPNEAAEGWRMRERVRKERDAVQPPERALKTGRGGLIDVEFALQLMQLHHGWRCPEIQITSTRRGWRALARAGLAETAQVDEILKHHRALLSIELSLRRDENRSVSVIPADGEEQAALARWLGFPDRDAFWADLQPRLRAIRRLVRQVLKDVVPTTTLETDT